MHTRPLAARAGRLAAAALLALLLHGCAAAPGLAVARPAGGTDREEELLVPGGNGSMLQDEITLTLRSDSVILKVTPLEEWVIRLTAPDTWSRLSSLSSVHRAEVVRQTGAATPSLFLVSFFSQTPGAAFHPQDVQIENRGHRQRPLVIRPLTQGWGEERLEQERAQLAVYAFTDEVDLEQPLTIEYSNDVAAGWDAILRRLEVERGRARARAGLGGR